MEAAGVDSWHLDVMDNHMAPCISFGPPVIAAIADVAQVPLDAHLMMDAPWLFFDQYIQAGVTDLCIHAEAYGYESVAHDQITRASRRVAHMDADRFRDHSRQLRDQAIGVGITINPDTPVSAIVPVLDAVDSVLVMSVHPGFSGQPFIPQTLPKIRELRRYYDGPIKVDGGVTATNAKALIDAGATVLISASYLFKSTDYAAAIQRLRFPIK